MKNMFGCSSLSSWIHFKFLLIGLLGVIFFLVLPRCDDIFEIDLAKHKVILIAPGDSVKTEFSSQTFYWEDLKGATSYNLQIVIPSFKHIEQIVADTNVLGHSFTLNLEPGYKYEWRVIGKNGSSKTDSFFIWTIQIDTTSNLSKQKVELNSPADGIASNGKKVSFQWKKLFNATGYEFQIGQPDFQNKIVIDSTLIGLSFIYNDSLPDGNYTWGVKAINSNTNSSTVFSTRTILIDGTKPAIPMLTEPTNKTTLTSKKVKFLWTRLTTDGGSKLSDDIYISTDSASLVQFNMSQIYKFEVDTIGFYNTFSVDTSYFWRVETFDAAGNRSGPSDIRKFKVKTTTL